VPDNNGTLDEVEQAEKIEAVSSDSSGILIYGWIGGLWKWWETEVQVAN
jgi:hypothetical protein